MNILFAASEITPVIKSGGLADVVGALPRHLQALDEDVRVIIPDYPQLDPKLLPNVPIIDKFTFDTPSGPVEATVKQGRIPGTSVTLYLLGLSRGLQAPTLYPAPAEGDQDRFPLFCVALLEWLKKQSWQPDIIHVHDWMTALLPYLVRQQGLSYKTVLTIHNLAYQGIFFREFLLSAGIVPPTKAKAINLLKTGIQEATKVNTVSPTYALEVLTREYGRGLQASLRQRSKDFSGILNGVDYSRYAPYADKALEQDYTMKTVIDSKIINKELLRKEVGLSANKQKPLFGVVSRIDSQKGLDLIEALIKDTPFMQHAQVVILGTGSKDLERKLNRLAKKHHGNLALILKFDEGLAHRIYAGSDFFLVPSKFEPCGLTQMIAMKYGTIPVVRRTGGLADTVVDAATNPAKGTGFMFTDYQPAALAVAANHALSLYQDKPALDATIETAMRQDFSWGKSAKEYVALYQKALKARRRSKAVSARHRTHPGH
jgi:starch synthase